MYTGKRVNIYKFAIDELIEIKSQAKKLINYSIIFIIDSFK